MQNNKKASILIWAIFLSLIISISFLSIANKVNNNSKTSKALQENIRNNIKIENNLKSFSWVSFQIQKQKVYIENKTLNKSLKKYEIFNISFPKASTWVLMLTSLWVLHYEFWSDSGFLDKTNSKYIFKNKSWILKLENYSWILWFSLNSNNKFDFQEKKYKITKKIAWKEIIKQVWSLK